MRLGGEIEDRVAAVRHGSIHFFAAADVAFYEMMTSIVEAFQILDIPGVREGVKVYDLDVRVFVKHNSDKRGADKAGTASDKEFGHKSITCSRISFRAVGAVSGAHPRIYAGHQYFSRRPYPRLRSRCRLLRRRNRAFAGSLRPTPSRPVSAAAAHSAWYAKPLRGRSRSSTA